MSYPKIIRNRYRVGETDNRQHASTHHEEDMRDFHLPLAALHQRHLHTWGVCAGLEVSGIVGASTVAVQPGVAIDMEGRMIVLANDGLAQTPEGNLVNVPVTLTLSTLTAGLYYVTFTYGENEQPEPGDTTGRTRPINVRQAPLVRLDAAEGFIENGLALILAVVGVDENHQLSQLSVQHGESGRRLVGQTVHTLAFQRPVTTAEQVTMVPAGNLSALPEGGLQLAVANAVDEIMVSGVDGNSFAALQIHANTTQIQGALTVQRSLHVGGDLQVAGATQLQGPLTVQSALQVSGDLQVAGATRLQGVLAVNTMIAGDLPADLNSAPAKLTITSSGPGDWIFLGQQRAAAGNGGFHVHNPWRDTDGPDRNRLEIAYRTTAGEDLWEQFVLHGPTGNIGIGNGAPTYKLDVNGSLNASELYINGAPLATILPAPSQWTTLENGIAYNGERVGIGTTEPDRTLTIEATQAAYLNARTAGGVQELLLGADSNGGIVSTMTNHDLQLRAGGNETKVIIKANGNIGIGVSTPVAKLEVGGDVRVNGAFAIPKTGGGFAEFNNDTYTNEAQFEANNLKLRLGHLLIERIPFEPRSHEPVDQSLGTARPGPIIELPQLRYQFVLGHSVSYRFNRARNFIPRFSIDQDGNLYCAGNKAGYVIDYFVNRVGEALEQGDVVVISPQGSRHFTGTKNNIPLLEVDLTDQAYDSRLCGIVAQVVTTAGLPFVELEDDYSLPDDRMQQDPVVDQTHPLQSLAPVFSPGLDMTRVQADQIGQMVTLGAFSHCKVDADIAPIAVGDLLTTSPTKGHAQKVVDITQASGAILGKALGALSAGRGKIPVLVTLH